MSKILTRSGFTTPVRKKPVKVAAMLVDGPEACIAASGWMMARGFKDFEVLNNTGAMRIGTLEGNKESGVPFVLIEGVQGEFYPCKVEIFDTTYERA